jgi:predicted transcriptional regulator
MQLVLKFKKNLKIVRLSQHDAEVENDLLKIFKELILKNEDMYPGIDLWFKNKVVPGLKSLERIAYISYFNNEPIATAIVKRGKSAKFCHLKINEEFQDQNLGELFFTLMSFDVGKHAEEIHFTLPESLWEERHKFFTSFGFTDIVKSNYLYRSFERELVCSSPFKGIWEHIKQKLPKLLPDITINDQSMSKNLLISIKPQFINKILDGTKSIEIRRKFHKNWIGHSVVLYATSPVKSIVGEAKISDVDVDDPKTIWTKYNESIGCSKEDFFKYTDSLEKAYAVKLSNVTTYDTKVKLDQMKEMVGKNLHPPQSYISVKPESKWFEAVSYSKLMQDVIETTA